jgi:hypothetical protein
MKTIFRRHGLFSRILATPVFPVAVAAALWLLPMIAHGHNLLVVLAVLATSANGKLRVFQ